MGETNISIIFSYARSGGTLLNRYLVNNPDLVVLSEAHPLHNIKGDIYSIKNQVNDWYGIKIISNDYFDQLIEIKKWCDAHSKYLVIRDWSYIDFTESYLNNFKPKMHSTNYQFLKSLYPNIKTISFVRDSIDIFLSQDKNLNEFSKSYFRYAKFIKEKNFKIFKYEDLIKNPKSIIKMIISHLGIKPLNNFDFNLGNKNVIGDILFSRGNKKNKATKMKRRFANLKLINNINKNQNLIKSNSLFNYPTYYQSKNYENFVEYAIFEFQRKVFRIIDFSKKIKLKLLNTISFRSL